MINKLIPKDNLYLESGLCLLDLVKDSYKNGKKVFLLITGGSSIQALKPFAEWLNKYHERLDDELVVTLTDERYSNDLYYVDSNAKQINDQIKVFIEDKHEIGLIDLVENSGGYKGIFERINHGSPKIEEINSYEHLLQKYLNNDEYTKIGIFGIGGDSHISGILPFIQNENKFIHEFQSTNLCSGYELPFESTSFTDRITTTLTALLKINHSIITISGAQKQEALQVAIDNTFEYIYKTPASILKKMQNVVIFSDLVIKI